MKTLKTNLLALPARIILGRLRYRFSSLGTRLLRHCKLVLISKTDDSKKITSCIDTNGKLNRDKEILGKCTMGPRWKWTCRSLVNSWMISWPWDLIDRSWRRITKSEFHNESSRTRRMLVSYELWVAVRAVQHITGECGRVRASRVGEHLEAPWVWLLIPLLLVPFVFSCTDATSTKDEIGDRRRSTSVKPEFQKSLRSSLH